ncbi:MAG: hypothetical protein LBJ89_01005 [Holosporales bacterium]|jgi:hypothetical protein|nr:hypothetical protein [Holosporales bacterium]
MPNGLANTAIPTVYSSFAKSHLVLSDGTLLDSENTALGAFFIKETGSPIVLSNDALSDQPWTFTKTEILERFTNTLAYSAVHSQTYETTKWIASAHFYCVNTNVFATSLHQTILPTLTASYTGAIFWHDHKHLNRPWNEEEPIVGT